MAFFNRQNFSFPTPPRNTSAPAPGANGPSPMAPQAIMSQAGRVVVQSNPGEPSAVAETQVHPKSKQVATHPAHAKRGRVADGSLVLEAGAVAGACAECNDSAS